MLKNNINILFARTLQNDILIHELISCWPCISLLSYLSYFCWDLSFLSHWTSNRSVFSLISVDLIYFHSVKSCQDGRRRCQQQQEHVGWLRAQSRHQRRKMWAWRCHEEVHRFYQDQGNIEVFLHSRYGIVNCVYHIFPINPENFVMKPNPRGFHPFLWFGGRNWLSWEFKREILWNLHT